MTQLERIGFLAYGRNDFANRMALDLAISNATVRRWISLEELPQETLERIRGLCYAKAYQLRKNAEELEKLGEALTQNQGPPSDSQSDSEM